jgi:hypothetical protein
LSTSSVPVTVMVPDVVIGPPVVVRPVVPPETSTLVTVPAPAVMTACRADTVASQVLSPSMNLIFEEVVMLGTCPNKSKGDSRSDKRSAFFILK